jgi:TolA-binding protein
MYLDVGVMKVQLAKLEGKLESHQEFTQLESQNRSLRDELDHVKTMVSEHRRKSTYDKQ